MQYHWLEAGHGYGLYVRDAKNAGRDDIASFSRDHMQQDSQRAKHCHEFLEQISGSDESGPALC